MEGITCSCDAPAARGHVGRFTLLSSGMTAIVLRGAPIGNAVSVPVFATLLKVARSYCVEDLSPGS